MADLMKLLDDATRSLIEGDGPAALQLLSEVEKKVKRKPDLMNDAIIAGLKSFSELAQAAGEGIADARALIVKAGGGARNLKTYDGNGNAQPVKNPRGALGRF